MMLKHNVTEKTGNMDVLEFKDEFVNPYNTHKLQYHPNVIENLRGKQNNTLIQVHLMPNNSCNQNCKFCSYRMKENKNSEVFYQNSSLSLDVLSKLVNDMKKLGVKAVEVTGGGEPLLYKHKLELFELLFKRGFDVALVTNGTLLDEKLAELIAPNLTWMRVSLDAGTQKTYRNLRRSHDNHFYQALEALKKIRTVGNHKKDFKLGAGYVMANGNELEVYEACRLAKEYGADNIRLSMTFSDQHMKYFNDENKVKKGMELAEKAVTELSDDSFKVINLIPERLGNLEHYKNDYQYCYTKDVLCVIEGEGKVYTCCTFTGSKKGLLGNINDHKDGLKGIWHDSFEFRKKLNPSTYCNVTCLYAKRNLQMIDIVDDHHKILKDEIPIHVNFI